MAKLRVIQCGVGGFGGGWVNVLKSSPDAECVAMVDVKQENIDKAVAGSGFDKSKCFATLEEAISKVQADAVLTVTPPIVHWEHAKLAFSKGLHVLTEKPLADSLEHGAEMVKLARQKDLRLMVSQNYRYNPNPRLLRSLVQENKFGGLVHGDITFGINASFKGTFRETMTYPLLVDMSIHHFDLMRSVIGSNAKSIFIRSIKTPSDAYQHECAFKGVIEFENGIVMGYSGDWGSPRAATQWPGDWALQFKDALIRWTETGCTAEKSAPWSRERTIESLGAPGMAVTGQAYSLAEFVAAIRENREAETSGADNLHSFGLVAAALESIKRNAPVNLADVVPAV